MKENKRTIKQMYKRLLLIPCMLMVLLAIGVPVCAAEYVHGYLHYTVADDSVTITAYTGDEEDVTVPSMIGGNPVNVIAGGAFAGSSAKMVYLPDTIMSVEEGAFSSGQSVVYASANAENGAGNGIGTDLPPEYTSPQDPPSEDVPPQEAPPRDAPEPVGISDAEGNLVTADTEGNLILVGTDGNETVLDDSVKYSVETTSKGEVQIKNESGEAVRAEDDGIITFQDADRNTVSVDTRTGRKTTVDGENRVSYEEIEINENPVGTEDNTEEET